MRRFTDDDRQFDVYASWARNRLPETPWRPCQTVKVVDWPSVFEANATPHNLVRSVEIQQLFQGPEPRLRVIFAPLDVPNAPTVDVVTALLRHYKAPPAFLLERLQSVTHSYGSRVLGGNRYTSWFHFLCKNLTVRTNSNGETVIDNAQPTAGTPSQSDDTWIKSGFYLTWGPGETNETCTTLICFGAHSDIEARFARLAFHPSWLDAVHSPFNLFVIVLEQLFLTLDSKVWDLSDVLRTMETKVLLQAASSHFNGPAAQFDFVALHNVSKYIAYMVEAANAMLLVVDDMQVQSRTLPCATDVELIEQVVFSLAHQKGLFSSDSLRLRSLDKRIQNIINLAFNLVTQQDSNIMKRDSDSMKTIAAVTLFFLPMSTVATIFGSQFFDYDSNKNGSFRVSKDFWLYWVIALPTTVAVICCWYIYHRWAMQHQRKD